MRVQSHGCSKPSGALLSFLGFWVPPYGIPTRNGHACCNVVAELPRVDFLRLSVLA